MSPEDILKEKDAFYFHKFLESFSQDMNNMFNTLIEKYGDPDAPQEEETVWGGEEKPSHQTCWEDKR